MLGLLSQRLLPLLQLTRFALVFTAVADSLTTLLLWTARATPPGMPWNYRLLAMRAAVVATISAALYAFGMSLNDIIDRRRDTQIAADRPLPSGRMPLRAAHGVCLGSVLLAVLSGAIYSRLSPADWASLVLVLWTGLLIAFYDLAGKYLVAPGLLTLGLIRFFHAVIPVPQLPLLWHPLLLLNHVAILSTVAYYWEQKRPPLTRLHYATVVGGLVAINAMAIGLVWWRIHPRPFVEGMRVQWGLVWPALAVAAFAMQAWWIRRRAGGSRAAGKRLMLAGLLWLIVFDAAFVAGYVGWKQALAVLAMLPLSYAAVRVLRLWSQVVGLSQTPQFKRLEL